MKIFCLLFWIFLGPKKNEKLEGSTTNDENANATIDKANNQLVPSQQQQQQIAVPKRKRRDRIPIRPNYR